MVHFCMLDIVCSRTVLVWMLLEVFLFRLFARMIIICMLDGYQLLI